MNTLSGVTSSIYNTFDYIYFRISICMTISIFQILVLSGDELKRIAIKHCRGSVIEATSWSSRGQFMYWRLHASEGRAEHTRIYFVVHTCLGERVHIPI